MARMQAGTPRPEAAGPVMGPVTKQGGHSSPEEGFVLHKRDSTDALDGLSSRMQALLLQVLHATACCSQRCRNGCSICHIEHAAAMFWQATVMAATGVLAAAI